MKRTFNLVKYDYLQRVRSYKFLIILCASLAFAFALIPPSGANYSTISIGDYLGHYNSAWIAYVTAMMASIFISLFGYYIINNSIRIDQSTKMGQLVAATDITNFQYLMTKFWGNCLILLTVIICVFFVGIVLFFMYNTGYPLELSHFFKAYIFIPLPSIILISALSIVLEVIFKRKSVLQNTIFFFLFMIMLTQGWMGVRGDAFGVRYPTAIMEKQVESISGSSEKKNMNIGFVIRQSTLEKRFTFSGPSFTSTYLLSRLIWPLIGVLLVYFSSKFFHRFELSDKSSLPKSTSTREDAMPSMEFKEIDLSQLPILEKSNGLLPVYKTELLMLIRKGKKWYWLVNILGIVLLTTTPLETAHKYVLPVLWFLQVHRWADLVSKEKTHQMHYFIYSSFKPVQRLLTAQYLAGISLAILLASPLIIRYLLLSNWIPILAILCGSVFIIALSTFIAIATGGKRLFEILFFFIAYLNVNQLPLTDYMGALHQNNGYLMLLLGVTIILMVLSFLLRKLELRSI